MALLTEGPECLGPCLWAREQSGQGQARKVGQLRTTHQEKMQRQDLVSEPFHLLLGLHTATCHWVAGATGAAPSPPLLGLSPQLQTGSPIPGVILGHSLIGGHRIWPFSAGLHPEAGGSAAGEESRQSDATQSIPRVGCQLARPEACSSKGAAGLAKGRPIPGLGQSRAGGTGLGQSFPSKLFIQKMACTKTTCTKSRKEERKKSFWQRKKKKHLKRSETPGAVQSFPCEVPVFTWGLSFETNFT